MAGVETIWGVAHSYCYELLKLLIKVEGLSTKMQVNCNPEANYVNCN